MNQIHLVGIDMELRELRVTAYNRSGEKLLGSRAEFDRNQIEDWVRALREANVYLSGDRTIVSAVGTSGTVIPVDEYGEQVFPPQWYFETAPDQAQKIDRLEVTSTLSEKGLRISASNPVSKILALREEHPQRFEQIEWLLSPATWILYRLQRGTDQRWRDIKTDWNNALKFGADITTDPPHWFEKLYRSIDVPVDLLPEITSPGAPIGPAESELATEIGLEGAELYQGLTDGNAAALAAGSLQTGDCSIIAGSSSVIKYVSPDIDIHPALYYHRHPIEGYLAGAAFETGVILERFCENVLGVSVEEGLRLAKSTDPGDEPRVYLQGDRSPFFNPAAGTTILDLWHEEPTTLQERRGRLVRGIATSIALSEHTYFPLLENHFGNTINQVQLVSGGEAHDQSVYGWWNTLRASIWEQEIVKMEPRTTVGALIPPALEASIYSSVEEASNTLLRSSGRISHDSKLYHEYRDRKDDFKTEWELVQDLYSILDRD